MSSLRIRILVYLLGTFAFAASFSVFPSFAHAATTLDQCKAQPTLPDCISFNPDVNPLLAGYHYNTSNGPAGKQSNVPDSGTCVLYNAPGFLAGVESGCVGSDGIFHIGGSAATAGPTGETTQTNTDTTAQGTAISVGNGKSTTCSPEHPLQCLKDAGMWIVKGIIYLFLVLASVFAGLGGVALNYVIYITVFQFGNVIGNNAGLLAAWGVLRDIGNLVLLFGFIFMGISTILNLPHNDFTAKKALPALIIFAVLMNFSLFAAEAVIDVSNAFGTAIYKEASLAGCSISDISCFKNYGLSSSVMKISGLAGIFDPKTLEAFFGPDSKGGDTPQLITMIGLTLLAAITAFVFFAAVFMFIIRLVVLAFIMVTSPLGFAGMAIPPLHGLAKQWWEALLKQSFFAPIYILMVLISIKFMQGVTQALGQVGSTKSLATAFTADGVSNISLVIIFFLVTGFMLAAVMIAQSMGAVGASNATRMAGGIVFGGMARVTNYGFGGLSAGGRAISSHVASRAREGSWTRSMALGATSVFRAGEKMNLDIRRAVPIKQLGAPAEHASLADAKHFIHERQEELRKDRQASENEAGLITLQRQLRAGGGLSPASQQLLSRLSAEQLAANHALLEAVEEAADMLSPDKFEELMKSKELNDDAKNTMRTNRFANTARLIRAAEANPGDAAAQQAARDAVHGMTEKDMAQFSQSTHSELMGSAAFARAVTDEQADKIRGNQNIGPATRTSFTASRDNRFSNARIDPRDPESPTHAAQNVPSLTPENFGKLSASTVSQPHVLEHASGRQLAKIDPSKLNPAQLTAVMDHLGALDGRLDPEWITFRNLVTANPANPWKGVTINGDVL